MLNNKFELETLRFMILSIIEILEYISELQVYIINKFNKNSIILLYLHKL